MADDPKCPNCSSENVYADGNLWICPECSHEWSAVTVIKELRIKGSTSVVKVGTKVKNIRLVDGGDGHDIGCKIDGIGAINLKSEFVKKA